MIQNTVANDYRAVDGTVTVTFTARRVAGNTPITIARAEPESLSTSEISALGGVVGTRYRRWNLGRNQIASSDHYPVPGDSIAESGGNVWRVLEADLDGLGAVFSCLCVLER